MPDIIPGVKTYDPTKVTVVIGGSIIKSWDTVRVVENDPRFTFKKGTSGEVTRSKNSVIMGTITFILPQTSEDNAIMAAYNIAGNLMNVSVIDRGGTSIHIMPQGTIEKAADAEYGVESGQREWTIIGQMKDPNYIGGN